MGIRQHLMRAVAIKKGQNLGQNYGRIIRRAMIDRAHLCDRKIAFRIQGMQRVYLGTVKGIENDGLWLDARDLLADAHTYGPSNLMSEFQTPVVFVPTTALQFLITAQE